MNSTEATYMLRRMASTWPGAGKLDDDALAEWIVFLAEYDPAPSWSAVKSLRESLRWRPSMAEFREAYIYALACGDDERRQLPGGESAGPDVSLQDIYGSSMDHWVYCWRCDMAISLDDLENRRAYDGSRGLHHRSCPRRGAAPQIPAVEKAAREKWYLDHKIPTGPNVDPVAYGEVPRRSLRRRQQIDEIRDLAAEAVRKLRAGEL